MIAAVLAAAAFAAPPPTAEFPVVVNGDRVSRGTLRRWADIAQRAAGGGPRRPARVQAASLLISYRWVAGEAAERGVVVTDAQVERSFRRQRRQSFASLRDYRRFLRESGQTHEDILYRVKVDLMSDRLRDLAVGDATDPDEQQARLDAFVREFRTKWRARTACRAPWISRSDCGATSPGRTRRSPARALRASRWDGAAGGGRNSSSSTVFVP